MSDLLHPDRDSGGIDHSDVLCDHKDGKERRVLHNHVDMSIVKQMGQPLGQIMNIIFLAFSVLYVMVFLYIYPVLAKFYNSTRNTFINAVLMSVRHLPYTVLMAVICACPVLLVSFAPTFKVQATIILICLVIGGAVVAYCNSFFLVKIFENYIPEGAEDGGKAE